MKSSIREKKINFSILMANYNNANYIEEAISSVLAQTYPYWELIIVDDCSRDESVAIIKSFLNDKRIKLIRHRNNYGYGGSLKTAASIASKEILGILDADDKLHPEALQIMVDAYQNYQDCGFIYSTMWYCDSELKNCKVAKWIGPVLPEKSNIFKSKISHFKTFLKKEYEKTIGFEVDQRKIVDKDIIYKLEEVTKFKFINKPLYYYRHHEGGISQGENKYPLRVYHYISKYKTYYRRLNTTIPNISKEALYIEYLELTFYKLISFIKYLYKKFIISRLFKFILNLFPTKMKNKVELLKGIYFNQVIHN